MNIYLVKRSSPANGTIRVNSYVVVAKDPDEACYAEFTRKQLYTYLTEENIDEANRLGMDRNLTQELAFWELPLKEEEIATLDTYYQRAYAKTEYVCIHLGTSEELVRGAVLCCDYYPG